MAWTPDSWRSFPILQQPNWSEHPEYSKALAHLERMPALVSSAEVRNLRSDLKDVALGESFLLQGGDCAESFDDFSERHINGLMRVLLQMAITLVVDLQKPVIKVARVAGQFAKPRSSPEETREGTTLPSYKGDMINGIRFDEQSRVPNPQRMTQAYAQSAATLNYMQSMARTGYAALANVRKWNSEFISQGPRFEAYQHVIERIESSIRFVEACGIGVEDTKAFNSIDLYTSHEGLVLDYEQPLTRQDPSDGEWYAHSAHMLWIGNRTRQLDHAHVEYMRGIANPIGIKVGPKLKPEELLGLLRLIDPEQTPGKIVLISRMGKDHILDELPPLVRTTQHAGWPVIWSCDPMHGNTVKASDGSKTRRFDDILSEITHFFDVVKTEGAHPGGIHLEMTGSDVTECVGGADSIEETHLQTRYDTLCDPRLNANQSLELSLLVAELFR